MIVPVGLLPYLQTVTYNMGDRRMHNTDELGRIHGVETPQGWYESERAFRANNDGPECFVASPSRELPQDMFRYDECRLVRHEIVDGKQFVWVEKLDPMKRPSKPNHYGTTKRAKIGPVYNIRRWESFGWRRDCDRAWK